MTVIQLLNITLHNLTQTDLLHRLHPYRGGGVVVTPNVDHLIKLQSDEEFYRLYQAADYRVCDSQILFYFSRILGTPIREKITGSDLLPAFYRHYGQDPEVRLFLLGGLPGTPEQAQAKINAKVGRAMVVGAYSPPFGFEKDPAECRAILERIRQSGATVVAVGLGAPKQEKWIFRYKDLLPQVSTFLAVGAAIGFEAGTVERAPRWMSDVGLEWFYRLLSEPQRLWRRYVLQALPFLGLILAQRCRLYRNPFTAGAQPASTPQTKLVLRALKIL
ncbi:UDP-N-acetyl-D-mannosaminuronic acid transferase [Halomicronema hongdechloris C2206]|uniref:UDP-N-acetyl-D-mannosaminuronic acid transferase n=1 Tax=Halomicronema hongdechloris C2206 TaxID=1641165 RepID=A0A1Z3HML9_9CYAN|nr:WecB/TagA/CpsF family glycosyltransferase [Halomicronema hongdechloris]ASC71554.1 UDP-N-acetyl-D-mannosaminuronic acid transferase [Halomicronema hongdechloris C2206]